MSNSSSKDALYRPYRTDLEPHYFSLMQRDGGFVFEDALEAGAVRSLFLPGCSLAGYSRELTQAVYGFLKERGLVDGMSTRCCGHILYFSADQTDFRAYTAEFAATLEDRGVTRIITACPNCYASLLETLQDSGIELVSLSEVFVDEGVRFSTEQIAPATSVCVYDACPDRKLGAFGPSVRHLFEGLELREMRHRGENALCCGLGRLLFISSPVRSENLQKKCIGEFKETGADLLVTYCISCASAFQDPGEGVRAVHYLELLFGMHVDWAAVDARARSAHETLEGLQAAAHRDLTDRAGPVPE
jgi:Fe-S oxidoreductase